MNDKYARYHNRNVRWTSNGGPYRAIPAHQPRGFSGWQVALISIVMLGALIAGLITQIAPHIVSILYLFE